MPSRLILFTALGILLLVTCVEASALHKPNTIVADWVRTRLLTSSTSSSSSAAKTTPQLWMYKGSLYDPLDGRKISNVEGLECISLWEDATNSSALQMESLLKNPNATFDDAATLRISKVFCYTTLDDSKPSLLRQIRVRPNSPRKTIPLDQTIALWETATTYLSRGDKLYVHSEWPSGEHLWAQTSPSAASRTATVASASSAGTSDYQENTKRGAQEFTVFTKRRSPKSRLFLPDLTSKISPASSNETVVSPKRSTLIQFGSSTLETQNKFGARETYRITSSPSKDGPAPKPWWLPKWRQQDPRQSLLDSRIQYTRYGEGPPFYAPGRMCMLELEARPIQSLDDASNLLQEVIRQHTKGFPKVTSAQPNTKSGPFGSFRLIPDATVDRSVLGKLQYKALQGWDKLKTLSSFQAGPFRFGL